MPAIEKTRNLPPLREIDEKTELGKAIEKARQIHGHSRQQMREYLQIGSVHTIHRWEQEAHKPAGRNAVELRKYIAAARRMERQQAE